jgi:hypothetical protein
MNLGRYSLGVGDRFGLEARAQLRSLKMALDRGVEVTPVWNKSNREHSIIGTEPMSVRQAADRAVKDEGWKLPYFIDADHIGLKTVDRFLDASDFFTIDVADFIGKPVPDADTKVFIETLSRSAGRLHHPDLEQVPKVGSRELRDFAQRYLYALLEAGKIYRYIERAKAGRPFITEVSVDEAWDAQTPVELFLFIAGLVDMGVRVQTVAPKFSGKFLKGIDYVGDINAFAREFKEDLAVVSVAREVFGLPDLKLSVHSGSDKFSLYPVIHKAMQRSGTGIHLKTAGTTWLEEVIGLASNERGLGVAKRIYAGAYERYEEMLKPYETVVEIERDRLPTPTVVNKWPSAEFIAALKHDQSDPRYSRDFRQLVHIAFRVASELGGEFRDALAAARGAIEQNVTENLYARHLEPLFVGSHH